MSTLEADDIRLEFGQRTVLSSVYIKCETGKITGILGRNGHGKSCLFNIVYGTLDATDKSIRVNGNSLTDAYTNPSVIRYLPQFHFFPVNLLVETIFKNFGIPESEFNNDFPGFQSLRGVQFGSLSGGEKRLIEVYVIVKTNTQFVLLDEPFSNLMPLHVEKIKEIIAAEKDRKGFLITDHLYKECIDICDNFYVLKDGVTYPATNLDEIKDLGYINEQKP